jgi:hypothetical protein
MTTIPAILLIKYDFEKRKFPIAVAVAPSKTKITENPKIKAREAAMVFLRTSLRSPCCRSSMDTPDINEIYAGTSGKTHGDKNESIPAANAVKIEIWVVSIALSFALSLSKGLCFLWFDRLTTNGVHVSYIF